MNLLSGSIRRVAIVGGTHGNELTGIYTIENLNRCPHPIDGYSFECMTLLANPKAIAANRRYIDRDLNRCFGNADLSNLDLTNYEDILAKEIAAKLGPKDRPRADVIIDLHTSTSNMGLTILLSSKHPFNLRLAAYLSTLHPDVRVCCGIQCNQDAPMLRSLSPLGCTIEVGAIAQGILNADLFDKTQMLVRETLNYIDAENQSKPLPIPTGLTVYQTLSSVDYPRDSSGKIEAMIHPKLQFQDYQPLQPGDPMFWTFTGESILYQGEYTVFPIFINEAAYYEKGIAMSLTEKLVLQP
ncbi:aspartoacylase [Chamaesiphon minutus]|uniref:Probable aspartoacylase n=1 Tax=Chamaesiphon minutus (strain ATCC 27169 / PCC 6605) TaxID=1173020 RepID=K9UAJ3_CHAP6|nr:aspartoacylase [Chamaesiphon minutus]AFY91648.1 succinylglutamate desuccinylase [Chamaesiphon minutus PCC 6605]